MAEEETYEFRDGEMVKIEAGQPVALGQKNWEISISAKKGSKRFPEITNTQKRKLMKCLEEARIPSDFKSTPIDSRVDFELTIKEDHDYSDHSITKEKAEKLKNCFEPISDLVSVSVKKMEEVI